MTAAILFSNPSSSSLENGRLSGSPQMRRAAGCADALPTRSAQAVMAAASVWEERFTDILTSPLGKTSGAAHRVRARQPCVYGRVNTCSVPPTDVALSSPDPYAAPTAPNAPSGSSRDRLAATGRPNQAADAGVDRDILLAVRPHESDRVADRS